MSCPSLCAAAKRIASPGFALRLIELRAECDAADEDGLPIDRAARVLGLQPDIIVVIAAFQDAIVRTKRLSSRVNTIM